MGRCANCECLNIPAESENLACVDISCAGIGRPREGVCLEIEATISEAAGKANRIRLLSVSPEESDGVVVPEKSANKGLIALRS